MHPAGAAASIGAALQSGVNRLKRSKHNIGPRFHNGKQKVLTKAQELVAAARTKVQEAATAARANAADALWWSRRVSRWLPRSAELLHGLVFSGLFIASVGALLFALAAPGLALIAFGLDDGHDFILLGLSVVFCACSIVATFNAVGEIHEWWQRKELVNRTLRRAARTAWLGGLRDHARRRLGARGDIGL
jgi:hypothetical protein